MSLKMSKRAKRMERHHKRNKRPGLNLVSLMDIFTILVFFLLVNSSSTQQLPSSKDIQLPKSVAQVLPKETLVIAVSNNDLLVAGRRITRLKDFINSEETIIASLEQELIFQFGQSRSKKSKDGQREITIMGDRDIPYKALKKIMATCTKTNYSRISLAVLQIAKSKG
ncbi:MAG: biopolymer transporter ExbD [Gammaproteobacteria bacterium]|nr:biopolymer transporter ExbD [Gammaproteobacteria bacterium]